MNKKIFFFIIIIFLLFIPIISKAESEDCRNRGKNDCSMGSICSSNADCKSGDCERSTKTDSNGNRIWFCDCGEVDGDWIPFVPETSRTCAQEYGGKAEDWLCKDGAAFSWDLDYCLDKKTPTNTKFPITTTETGFLDTIFDPTGAAVKSVDEIQSILKSPSTKINIPGLNFSEPKAGTDETGQTYVFIPFIGEYLKAIYKWLIAALGVFAIVRLMQAGFGWLMSGGSAEKITVEQKKIQNAIAGLALAVGSYVLLYTINPVLVEFRNLKVLYVETIPLTLEFLSNETYESITGSKPLPKTEIFKKAEEISKINNLDPCILGSILLTESRGNPAVIGHDENANVAKKIKARKDFLLSGVKFSSTTFTPSPGTENNFDPNENKRKVWNDDGGKYLNTTIGPPDYGIDWRYTHGFGLGQITISGKEFCSPGVRGATRCGKCYTIPQLLTAESSLEISACLMKKNIEYAKKRGWTNEDDIMRAAFWGYAAGPGNIPNASAGSSVLYGKKADGTRKPGDSKWEPYKQCKNSNNLPMDTKLNPEPPAELETAKTEGY